MHVLPLPFGVALALLPRREARLFQNDRCPIRVTRAPDYRERILADMISPTYWRPIA
jgi:hypothetical protein